MFKYITRKIYNLYLSLYYLLTNQQEKERELQSKLDKIIINSTDPEELKNKIVKEIAIELNASRCFFIEYDLSTNNFKKISNFYNPKRDTQNISGCHIETKLPSIAVKLKYMKSLVINDTNKYIKKSKLVGSSEAECYEKFDVKAFLAVRLEFGENFLGNIFVHYDYKKPFLKDLDLKALQNVAEHISIALHLSKLYVEEKVKKEEERLLRHIISTMSEDYDLAKITQKIFDLLSSIYNAQTVFINVDMENFKNFYFYDYYKYKTGDTKPFNKNALINIYNFIDFDPIKSKFHYISDTHNFVIQNNLENSSIEKFFNRNNIKSLILLPILHEHVSYGLLVIHFNKTNSMTSNDLEFIKTVTDQLAIAIKQTGNYIKEKKTAERESLLRRITETIRSSLNIEEILSFICNETTKVFNVQRTAIIVIPDHERTGNVVLRKEYKVNPEIKGVSDTVNFSKIANYWGYNILNHKDVVAFDDIEESETPSYFKETYKSIGVKSAISAALKKGENTWGGLVLYEYNNYRCWSDEEKAILKTIADQIYIAINQAELYEALKQTNIKQKAILNNIPYWAWLKSKDGKYIFVNEEYAKDKNMSIESFIGKSDLDIFPKEYAETYMNDDKIVMESKELETVFEEETIVNGKKRFLETYKQPFFDDEGNVIGTVGIAKDITERKETEIELLHRQEQIEKAHEREVLLRKVFETMRSSLDINKTKKTIVTEIGKALNADICFIAEYNKKEDFFFVDENSEYRVDEEQKSFEGTDTKNYRATWFNEQLKMKNEISYSNIDEFMIAQDLQGTTDEMFLKSYNIKASYSVPIHFNTSFAYIVVHYTKDYKKLQDSELDFLRLVATQAGVALYQADLYKKTQIKTEE